MSDPLARLLAEPGPWTVAYVDGHGDRPRPEEEGHRRAVREGLSAAGAPEEDIESVDRALQADQGVPAPSAHYLLVRHGTIEVDEQFTGARLGAPLLRHGHVPEVLPLLRHRAADVPYLLVETGRDGGEMRLRRAHRTGDLHEADVEGREPHHLQKVRGGGWSHRRIQAHAEEVWKHNQSEIADAVDRMVREHEPRFVVIAGDVRARQLLLEQLSVPARERVVDVAAHTRPDGADDTVVDDAVAEAIGERLRGEIAEAVDLASANDGADGARGADAVRDALRESRVATLVLDARLGESERTIEALDGPPWVSAGEGDTAGTTQLGSVPLAEGLARAAVLTDARVLIVEEEPLADDEHRPSSAADEPLALLRWSQE
ncbi:Vms1/Ankzf1 family peptidyl-tRNA hydrolase [Microbacterium sp. G2-8]|uniref:baeRF2 domain-containing protein n=1 Tax=Microbacterium sp. G2-8 TaxID=2842454 RepID=UPI001C89EFF5|nr:Vms1/Ankzf1 family peptidyl-tRNA hydrolase [Microbacterium sp. G2-8]